MAFEFDRRKLIQMLIGTAAAGPKASVEKVTEAAKEAAVPLLDAATQGVMRYLFAFLSAEEKVEQVLHDHFPGKATLKPNLRHDEPDYSSVVYQYVTNGRPVYSWGSGKHGFYPQGENASGWPIGDPVYITPELIESSITEPLHRIFDETKDHFKTFYENLDAFMKEGGQETISADCARIGKLRAMRKAIALKSETAMKAAALGEKYKEDFDAYKSRTEAQISAEIGMFCKKYNFQNPKALFQFMDSFAAWVEKSKHGGGINSTFQERTLYEMVERFVGEVVGRDVFGFNTVPGRMLRDGVEEQLKDMFLIHATGAPRDNYPCRYGRHRGEQERPNEDYTPPNFFAAFQNARQLATYQNRHFTISHSSLDSDMFGKLYNGEYDYKARRRVKEPFHYFTPNKHVPFIPGMTQEEKSAQFLMEVRKEAGFLPPEFEEKLKELRTAVRPDIMERIEQGMQTEVRQPAEIRKEMAEVKEDSDHLWVSYVHRGAAESGYHRWGPNDIR